jgi:hypothetical protein
VASRRRKDTTAQPQQEHELPSLLFVLTAGMVLGGVAAFIGLWVGVELGFLVLGGLDTTAVTAWATVILAGVGVASIVANFSLVRTASREADAATAASIASRDLITETQRDRELSMTPFVILETAPLMSGVLRTDERILLNIGHGGALSLRYCGYYRGPGMNGDLVQRLWFGPFALAPQARRSFWALDTDHPSGAYRGPDILPGMEFEETVWEAVLDGVVDENFRGYADVAAYKDVFGNKYRWIDGHPYPEAFYHDQRATESWRPGEPEPRWTLGW